MRPEKEPCVTEYTNFFEQMGFMEQSKEAAMTVMVRPEDQPDLVDQIKLYADQYRDNRIAQEQFATDLAEKKKLLAERQAAILDEWRKENAELLLNADLADQALKEAKGALQRLCEAHHEQEPEARTLFPGFQLRITPEPDITDPKAALEFILANPALRHLILIDEKAFEKHLKAERKLINMERPFVKWEEMVSFACGKE